MGALEPRGGMVLPLRAEPWPKTLSDRPCPVCLERWRPWFGSRLPCHAACLFDEQTQDAMLASTRPLRELAKLHGVSVAIVRANIAAALKRRIAR